MLGLLTAILVITASTRAGYPRAALPLKPFRQLIATRYTVNEGLPPGAITDVRVMGLSVVAFGGGKWVKLLGKRWGDLGAADPTPASLAYPLSHPGFDAKVLSA